MRLSPYAVAAIKQNLGLFAEDRAAPTKNKAIEVTRYQCPVCSDLHAWEDDAEDCCKPEISADATSTHCPVCAEHYETHEEAADCCLWKDYDAASRWKIARRVADGSDWLTELGLTN